MVKPWEGIISIPEGKSGDYKIRHIYEPPGEIKAGNLRTSIIGGQKAPVIQFDRKTKWHELSYEGGVWMTDYPIEQRQQDETIGHSNRS